MREIVGIIVHCTATQTDFLPGASTEQRVAEVKRWHVDLNGWSDIGYHFLIDRDGTVQEGRPVERTGAHVAGHNTGTIGVALFGGHGSAETDSFSDHFTEAQDRALRKLIVDIEAPRGDLTITGHNEYAAKACPGFQVARWLTEGSGAKPAPQAQEEATNAVRLRWRLAEIRDIAERALEGK